MSNVYGIDLGTTYSAISFINPDTGRAEIIQNSNGREITPSIVYFESPDSQVVGESAKAAGRNGPDEAQRVVNFIKREMHDKNWTREFFEKEWNPVEISTLILNKLVKDARNAGHEVQDVVITCPAYFGNEERKKTRQAGELAGLDVLEILDEPVAAALNYGLEQSNVNGKNVIVYDLGGGTFDVTVISIGSAPDNPDRPEITVICTAGDHQLGGYNWDQKIIDYFVSEFEDATGTSISAEEDPEGYVETMYDLKVGAEERKIELKDVSSVTQTIIFGTDRHRCQLTLEKFNDLTKELLQTTLDLTDKVLQEAREKGVEKIDTWLLVGGSTRMLQVHEALAQKYGLTENVDLLEFDPDKAVAKGAAKEAQIVKATGILRIGFGGTDEPDPSGQTGGIPTLPSGEVLRNAAAELGMTEEQVRNLPITKKVATKSYGIGAEDENDQLKVHLLIKRNEQIPPGGTLKVEQLFGAPGGDTIKLDVYSSDETADVVETEQCDIMKDSETGSEEIPFILPAPVPRNAPIAIKFELDEQGDLKLFAVDKTSNTSKEARFTAGLTEAQMEEARQKLLNSNVR